MRTHPIPKCVVILSLLHLQIQFDGQGSAGLHGLVGQLRQIVPESSGELRQLVVASRGEQEGRGLSHDTSQCQDDTGDDTRHGGRQKDGAGSYAIS